MSPVLAFTDEDWLNIDRELCSRGLVHFIRASWHIVEPAMPYSHGWHIDAMCEHLEAVHNGQIRRLLINVPPGAMKSLLTGVFFPAWEWGPMGKPSTRYVSAAHNQNLAIRDNLKARRLISSEWYQKRWPVKLTTDQNEKRKFENDKTGFREAMAFTSLTGSRGDRVLIDDPLSVDDALSDTKRESVNTTFAEAVPSRLNSPINSAIVVIMQRLHQKDVSALILEKELGYDHLCIPMEFEVDHPHKSRTALGFVDPRTKDGDLMFPERFPRDVVERDKKALSARHGSSAVAGQLQQRPAARDGEMFKRAWFPIVDAAPARARRVRGWDMAATEPEPGRDPDFMAGVRMSEYQGVYYVEHVCRDQPSPNNANLLLKNTAQLDGKMTAISIPQDPGSAGKVLAQSYTKLLAGWAVTTSTETGSKEVRATYFAAQCEAGNVRLVRGDWNAEYVDELCTFPRGKHDDQVDASSRAFNQLASGSTYSLGSVDD